MFKPSRREALRMAIGTSVALGMGGVAQSIAAAADETKPQPEKTVRLGIIGVGARGTDLLRAILKHPALEVPAICDIDPAAAKRAAGIVEKDLGKAPEL